ncbi:hypothetical protein BDF20DRAFT_844226, partial [Mycotypha africana]|uniref:uncharacterized protein n=1 Tax=Mycotypha africana TaxID=64632 RepID=UPI00230015DB
MDRFYVLRSRLTLSLIRTVFSGWIIIMLIWSLSRVLCISTCSFISTNRDVGNSNKRRRLYRSSLHWNPHRSYHLINILAGSEDFDFVFFFFGILSYYIYIYVYI